MPHPHPGFEDLQKAPGVPGVATDKTGMVDCPDVSPFPAKANPMSTSSAVQRAAPTSPPRVLRWALALVSFLIASGAGFGFFFTMASMHSSQTESASWGIGAGVGLFFLVNCILQAVARMPDGKATG